MQDSKRAASWLQCWLGGPSECIYREYTLRIRGEKQIHRCVTKDLHNMSYYYKRGITNPWFDVLQIRLMVGQSVRRAK